MTLPSTKIAPLYNQIVVLRDEPPRQIGLIHIPDTARDRLMKEGTTGTVLRVGPGKYKRVRLPHKREHDNGPCIRCGEPNPYWTELCPRLVDTNERVTPDVQRGDRVWFHHLAGTSDDSGQMNRQLDIEEGGHHLTVMWDDEVMAIDWDARGMLEIEGALGVPGAQEALASALSS